MVAGVKLEEVSYSLFSFGFDALKGVSAGRRGEQSMGDPSPRSETDAAGGVLTAGGGFRRRAAVRVAVALPAPAWSHVNSDCYLRWNMQDQ